jgi:hypothetical protein
MHKLIELSENTYKKWVFLLLLLFLSTTVIIIAESNRVFIRPRVKLYLRLKQPLPRKVCHSSVPYSMMLILLLYVT